MTAKQKAQKLRKRGRRFLDRAERLRVAVWYWTLRARGFNDYQLDLMFDGEDPSTPARGVNRKRKFETIRERYSLPGRSREEKFAFVKRVDAHPALRGTTKTYFSEFWSLMTFWELPHQEARRLLNNCLRRLGLKRLTYWSSEEYRKAFKRAARLKPNQEFSAISFYKTLLQQALKGRPIDLNLLALVGALYKEAYLAQDLRLALIYGEEYFRLMEELVAQPWIVPIEGDFRLLATRAMLRGRVFDYEGDDITKDMIGVRMRRLIVRKDDPLAKYAEASIKKMPKPLLNHLEEILRVGE
jgi:hypothetical protein